MFAVSADLLLVQVHKSDVPSAEGPEEQGLRLLQREALGAAGGGPGSRQEPRLLLLVLTVGQGLL